MTDFSNYSDDQLIKIIREGNSDSVYCEEFLLKKYNPLIKKEIRFLFLVGADTDDLTQEAMIGLLKAVREYDLDGRAEFITYATHCIRNQIKSAITAYQRKKHTPLNSYISLYSSRSDDEEMVLSDAIGDSSQVNPEELVIKQEKYEEMFLAIDEKLSPLEKKVVRLYLDGLSHADIAKEIKRTEKAVNNALTRVHNKLKAN